MSTVPNSRVCQKCQLSIPSDSPEGMCPHCALVIASETLSPESALRPKPPEIPTLKVEFPELEILELIGQGGMGFVYQARQLKLDRIVALKILANPRGSDPSFAERFHREAKVLAKLNHSNIVAVHDFGQTPSYFFLTMEFVDGVNLRQAMHAGRFTPTEALKLIPQLCDAIQYAHDEGVLHRDIKPENILIDTRGRVKIADFGIAKLLHEDPRSISLTVSGASLGTPHYMAPEQVESPADVDHRADIYSLGVVFYELLTSELPIGRFSPPSKKSSVNTQVDDVVMRTLEKERESRFQSAGDVKKHVEQLGSGELQAKSAPARSRVDPPELSRWLNIAWLALGLALVAFWNFVILSASPLSGAHVFSIVLPTLGSIILGSLATRWFGRHAPGTAGHRWALLAATAWGSAFLLVLTTGIAVRGMPRGFAAPIRFLIRVLIPLFMAWIAFEFCRHCILRIWNRLSRTCEPRPPFFEVGHTLTKPWPRYVLTFTILIGTLFAASHLFTHIRSLDAPDLFSVLIDPQTLSPGVFAPEFSVIRPTIGGTDSTSPSHVNTLSLIYVPGRHELVLKTEMWSNHVNDLSKTRIATVAAQEGTATVAEVGYGSASVLENNGDGNPQLFFRFGSNEWQPIADVGGPTPKDSYRFSTPLNWAVLDQQREIHLSPNQSTNLTLFTGRSSDADSSGAKFKQTLTLTLLPSPTPISQQALSSGVPIPVRGTSVDAPNQLLDNSTGPPSALSTSRRTVFFFGSVQGKLAMIANKKLMLSEAVLEMNPPAIADLSKIRILRAGKDGGQPETLRIDLHTMLRENHFDEDIELRDGDKIDVPAKIF